MNGSMIWRAVLVCGYGMVTGSAFAQSQNPVQQQQQQQFQAEQNRLGYEQQRQQQQSQMPAPYRFLPSIPYMHSAFAATPSGRGWGVGFSEHTDIDAQENATRECEKTAKNEKCLMKLNGGGRPGAAIACYLINEKTDEVYNWVFKDSKIGTDDAVQKAMAEGLSDERTGSPHRCVPIATWNPPPMPESR